MRATIEQLCAYKQRFPVPKFELPENITDDFDITEAEKVIVQGALVYRDSNTANHRTLGVVCMYD